MAKATLYLENGQAFQGEVLHYTGELACELVFVNCGIGYQDVLTDPSFVGQGVVFTAPIIGNYGVDNSVWDDNSVRLSLLVVQELARTPSNFQADAPLPERLKAVPVLTGVDTRVLVKLLRDNGPMRALLSDKAYATPPLEHMKGDETFNAVQAVTCRAPMTTGEGRRVVLLDLGTRAAIAEGLVNAGCQVVRLPATATAADILAERPEGLVLTNGPGDPRRCESVLDTVKALLGKLPIWGISLGHELLALAAGAQVTRLPYGHRGNSLPVQDAATRHIRATVQNHAFSVDERSLPTTAMVTSRNLNDGTVEGLDYPTLNARGTQYFPSSVPLPLQKTNDYDAFVAMLGGNVNA